MSTRADNVQNNDVIRFEDGMTATKNADGSYTVTGGDAEENGVWDPVAPGTEGAWEITETGTQFDGTWWMKR